MKTVNGIKTQERVEKLTGEQREDFFTKLIMEKDVTEEVETSRGMFTVKYPKAKDLLDIGRIRVRTSSGSWINRPPENPLPRGKNTTSPALTPWGTR